MRGGRFEAQSVLANATVYSENVARLATSIYEECEQFQAFRQTRQDCLHA